jgi:hypothetical protein
VDALDRTQRRHLFTNTIREESYFLDFTAQDKNYRGVVACLST